MTSLYNEIDAYAAAWLGNLIDAGHVAPGVVDARSIKELTADDLRHHAQVHLFAGIGGWSHALRLAGWPDDRPVWTGSCPCQPFSAAGKGKGQADERHLWPEMFRLIRECRPGVVFGEQVASAIGHGWLDGVSADLEGESYAVGSVVLGAHSVGAPHIRQRLFWVGYAKGERRDAGGNHHHAAERPEVAARTRGASDILAYASTSGRRRPGRGCEPRQWRADEPGRLRAAGGVDVAGCERHADREGLHAGPRGQEQPATVPLGAVPHGFWSAFDALLCRDGKARRVEPGTFPLAHGVPARVGKLRAYGNAIVPQVAAEFIAAFLATESECAA